MSGNVYLILAMIMAFASAVIGLLIDKFPDNWKSGILIVAALLAFVSGIFNLVGSKRTESENKNELAQQYKSNTAKIDSIHILNEKKQDALNKQSQDSIRQAHLDAEFKIDMLHTNYANDMKEAFGILSHRTIDQFLGEKVPLNLSLEETEKIVRAAMNKWVRENIGKSIVYDPKLLWMDNDTSSAGCWLVGSTKFKRNFQITSQNICTYWDGNFWNMETPNDHKYVHVIVDSGSKLKEGTFITNELTEKSRDLYYKYSRWYDAISAYQSTHQTYSHVLIIVMDERDKTMDEMLSEEMNLWVGYERNAKLNNNDHRSLFIYGRDELKNVLVSFE